MESQHTLAQASRSPHKAGSRRARWLACGLWAVAAVVLGLGLWLEQLNAGITVSAWRLYGLTFMPFVTVGALVAALRPHNAVGWIFLAGGLLNIVWSTAHHYVVFAVFVRPDVVPPLPLALFLAQGWISDLGIGIFLFFVPLLFPDGRLPSPRWRTFMAALVVAWIVHLASTILRPGPLSTTAPLHTIDNPFAVLAATGPLAILQATFGIAFPLFALGSAGSIVVRYRQADAVQRQQLRWFLLPAILLILLVLIRLLGHGLGQLWIVAAIDSVGWILFATTPIATGIAILRHQLFNIDVIIRRTVIYGALTACLGGLYAFAVGAAGLFLPSQISLLPLLVTLAVAVSLARPLHRLLQRLPLPQGQPAPEEVAPVIANTDAQERHADSASAQRDALLTQVVPWLGMLSAVASVSLAIGAVIFAALNGRPFEEVLATNSLGGGLFALADAGIGALVAVRRPRHPLGWTYCAIALSQWLGIFAIEYATYALVTSPEELPGGGLMSWLGQVVWFPGASLLLTFALLLFPTGRLPSPQWKPLAWAAVGLQALWATVALAAWPHRGRLFLEHPDQIPGSWITDVLGPLIPPLLLLCGLASIISLAVRFRRAGAVERQQIKWLGYGAATFLVAFVIGNVVPQFYAGTMLGLLLVPFSACIPLATGIAILRHRLFDIDVVIRRTVIYGALTTGVAGVYALAVGMAGALLPGQGALLPALITLAVAVPVAHLLHRLLARLPLPQGRPEPEERQVIEEGAALTAEPVTTPSRQLEAGVVSEGNRRRSPSWGMTLARIAWIFVAASSIVFFVAALPEYYRVATTVCALPPCQYTQLNAEAFNILQQYGVSIETYAWSLIAISVGVSLPFQLVGIVIFWRRPDDRMAWLASLMLVTLPVGASIGMDALIPTYPWLWLPLALLRTVADLSIITLFYMFPDGLFKPRFTRWLVVGFAPVFIIAALSPNPFDNTALILLLAGLTSAAAQLYRYQYSSNAVQRQQTKWVSFGFIVAAIVNFIGFLPIILRPEMRSGTGRILYDIVRIPFFTGLPLLLLPVTLAIAILRHRLFDIDVIIRRTVTYSALVGTLALVYAGSVALIQGFSRALTGPQSDLAIVALTLLIAALFNPLRLRVQTFIDRRFYREKVDFRVAFTAFAREVRTVIELPALLRLLVERTTALLHIAHGAVFLRDGGGAFYLAEGRALPPAADALPADTDMLARLAQGEPISRPRDATFPLLVPLLAPRPAGDHSVATDLVGVLALGPRLSDQRFSRDDESLLLGLADQAGTAIYVAQLIAEQRVEAQRREEQERQIATRRSSPIGRAEAAAEALLADQAAAFATLHRLANEAGQSVETARLLEHLPRAISLLDHPAAPRLTGLADGLSYLVASRAQPELLPAGLRTLITRLQPIAGEPLDGAEEALALYSLCARALEASSVGAIAELLPELPGPDAAQPGPLAELAQALGELHEAASALRAYERVDTPQDRLAYLAAAVERLSRADRAAAELGAADQPLVQRIVERWLAVAAGVMGELQTRARLVCRLLTRHTWQDDLVALTLTIRNDGRGAALNLGVSLTAGGEYTPLDEPAQVEQLAMGEEVSLTLRVRPHLAAGAGYFRARFLLRYDDPRGPDQVEQFADEVQLLANEGLFQLIPNPYVIGTPLQNGSPLFFGRQDVLGFIQENLQAAHRNNLVLIGQRRTGKTSLLKQLPDRLGDAYLPVYLDGQSLGLDPGMPNFFLALATEIAFALDDHGISVDPPEPEEFAASPAAAFERGFLLRVRAALGGRHLLLLLDEFEELEAAVRRGSLDASVFGFLRHLIQHSADLSVIFCGTHRLEELAADYWSVLFNISLYRHVGFLSRDEAERLVQEPVLPYGMRYDGLALEKIWRVTSGHPYFLQLLCHSLVNRHNRSGRSYLTVADLNEALDEILAAGEAHFIYLWAESTEPERLVLAALSPAVPLTGRATPAQVADELAGRGVVLERGAIAAALHRLTLRDILAATDSADAGGDAYGWKLGLLGLWVEKYRSLSRVIDEVRG